MIPPDKLYDHLSVRGIDFFTGVPDSLLKNFLALIQDHAQADQHIITANEGLAIGLAAGYHFRTGKIPFVYLQNSGLGNTVNPLTSLAGEDMYGVPILMMIGWRGRPGKKDEPQHTTMGRITPSLLDLLGVPCFELNADEDNVFGLIDRAIEMAISEQKPVALLVPENIFSEYESFSIDNGYPLTRETIIKELIGALQGDEVVVCTTGKSGREFEEMNKAAGSKIRKYFLNTGAMGHTGHIAIGIKTGSDDKIILLDGDGALLMQLGSMPTIAHHIKENFVHIVINNGCHESVGGQPTEAFFADCCGIAKASGYPIVVSIRTKDEWQQWLENGLVSTQLQFVEIRTNAGSRADLGRPEGTPIEWKERFMRSLKK